MFNKKISDKEAEIKSLAKECEKTEFYDRIHYIHLKDKLILDHTGLNIINHHFTELDMFITDRLSDRKMSVKRVHTSQFKIDDQICKFVQDGRNVRAEILITSFCKEITPNQLLCKVQIEKLIDTDKSIDPFFIPLPHRLLSRYTIRTPVANQLQRRRWSQFCIFESLTPRMKIVS